MINKLLIIVTIIRHQPGNLSFTFAEELERDIITNIGSRDEDIYECEIQRRCATRVHRPSCQCACTL